MRRRLARLSPSGVVATLALVGVALLAALYLASISSYWSISADSATYVGWGRALASGQGWKSAPPQPPVTSLLYAAVLYLAADGYVALNTFTQLLLLASLGLSYALLARNGDWRHALLAVLLSLASKPLQHASTQLLSEPPYMLFSTAALWLLDSPASGAAWRSTGAGEQRTRSGLLRECLAGVLMITVSMTRTIGLTLPFAVLLVRARARFERGSDPGRALIVFALLPVLCVTLWEIYAMDGSYVAGLLRAPFVDDTFSRADVPSLGNTFENVRESIRLLPAVGALLLNTLDAPGGALAVALHALGALVFALGLVRALRRCGPVTPVYVLLFVVVTTAHTINYGDLDRYRFLVPVLPFVCYYAIDGARYLIECAGRLGVGNRLTIPLQAVGAAYLAWYVSLGMSEAMRGVRKAHASPFGSYPIKRPENYDVQRIALWVKAHSRPEDRYASAQRDMLDVLTERRGADIVPGLLRTKETFIAWIDEQQVRYVLVDRTTPVWKGVLAAVSADPRRFHPLLELPRASLYEVQPRQE